jgi:hypothetical protein
MTGRSANVVLEALYKAQATLNPMSGFLKKGTPKHRKYIEEVRDDIRAAIKAHKSDMGDME